jgi:two-component system NtrC family sensor kinase
MTLACTQAVIIAFFKYSWLHNMAIDYKAAYERERTIRKEAEQLLEDQSRELYNSMENLKKTLADLKASQNQLVQTEKMSSLGVLAAGIAHEINNPISYITSNFDSLKFAFQGIQSFVQNMQIAIDNESSFEAIHEQWQLLVKKHDLIFLLEDFIDLSNETSEGLSRVKQIVADLRAFSREDTAEKVIVDINETLRSSINILENQIKYHATITTKLTDLPPIMGFAGKLSQVFTNLISNANQAVDDHGSIHIFTEKTENNIQISVQDNGHGISEENMSHLFTPFFTTKPIGEGTGLGLSISHGIIEEHEGTILVSSQLNVGTTFTVQIPLTQAVVD